MDIWLHILFVHQAHLTLTVEHTSYWLVGIAFLLLTLGILPDVWCLFELANAYSCVGSSCNFHWCDFFLILVPDTHATLSHFICGISWPVHIKGIAVDSSIIISLIHSYLTSLRAHVKRVGRSSFFLVVFVFFRLSCFILVILNNKIAFVKLALDEGLCVSQPHFR